MHSVLIVDDFYIDRENLKDMITALKDLDIKILGECETGFQALNFIARERPDIILSDIEMPGMGGLELADAVRREYPDIKIVFCTFYSQFEYAKKAIYLDGNGYLLKPVDQNELRECMKKVTGLIDAQISQNKKNEELKHILHESRHILVEDFLKGLIYGLNKDPNDIWGKIDFFGIGLEKGVYSLALMEIDDYGKTENSRSIEQKQILTLRVAEQLKRILNGAGYGIPARIDDSHLIIVFSMTGLDAADECSCLLSDICHKVTDEFQKLDISLSIAVSGCCTDIREIESLFEQCNYLLRHKYLLGKGKVIREGDIPAGVASPAINYNAIQKEIRFLLNSGSAEEIGHYIEGLFVSMPENAGEHYLKNLSFHVVICLQTVLYENNEDLKNVFDDDKLVWEKLLRFETIIDVKNWLVNLCKFTNGYLARKNADKNKLVTREVKKYIERNFKTDLNLEIIAAKLYYSPNYLNNIFKQDTGETICEFICKYRIEKAKALLSDSGIRLYEVAEAIGYSQPAYFSSVFKKYTGLLPREYRERFGQC